MLSVAKPENIKNNNIFCLPLNFSNILYFIFNFNDMLKLLIMDKHGHIAQPLEQYYFVNYVNNVFV